MRVLVTTFPGYGHFHPVAPLALALRRGGHDVRVATHASFGRWVEACGLTVLPAGRSEDEMVAETAAFGAEERSVRLFTTISVPAFASDVLAACERWRPDLVVSEEGEHAGPLIASMLGVPSATHSWPAPARPPEERAARTKALEGVWREYGQRGLPRLYGEHYLDCCPPALQTDAVETIDGVVAVRPTLFDGPPVTPPRWLEDVVPPVVFVTLGTVSIFARSEVLCLIVDAVLAEAGTVIATTGPHPDDVIPAHPKLRCARYLPLSTILPVTDLVISHGGASTTVACLLEGVPHLVVPQGAPSQRRAAASVAAMGIGDALDQEHLDGKKLASAATRLLKDRTIRDRINTLRATFDALPDPEEVARTLERLVT
jgi:UDP:flavonoid glycosyltransferase YjiC (YdhE family)